MHHLGSFWHHCVVCYEKLTALKVEYLVDLLSVRF